MKKRFLVNSLGIALALAGCFLVQPAMAGRAESSLEASPRYAAKDSVPANPAIDLVPDAAKGPYVKVTITIPTSDKLGNTGTPVTKVTLYRAASVYKTFTPQEGQTLISFNDTVPTNNKSYAYGVIAANRYGNSARVNKTIFVGQQKPQPPTNIKVFANLANHRKGSASWSAPTLDSDKKPLDPSVVTYDVYLLDFRSKRHQIASNLADTTISFEWTEPGFDLFQVLVEGVTAGGKSSAARSGQKIFLGDSITSYDESWLDGRAHMPLLQGVEKGNPSWYSTHENRYLCTGSDNDHGFFSGVAYTNGSKGVVMTNYLDLRKCENPNFTFSVFKFPTNNQLDVEVMYMVDSTFTPLTKFNVNDLPKQGWNVMNVNLNSVKDRMGQVVMRVTWIKGYQYFFADNFHIGNPIPSDLGIGYLQVPTTMKVGMPEKLTAHVWNYGADASSAYSVNLHRNGKVVATKQMPSLKAFGGTEVEISDVLTEAYPDSLATYSMTLSMAGDVNSANDSTNCFTVPTSVSVLPPVRALVSNSKASVDISWNVPDVSKLPVEPVVEDFEAYEPWQGKMGNWLNIDGDKLDVKGFNSNGQQMPVTGKQAFFIYDCDVFSNIFGIARPGSGHRFPISLYTVTNLPNNDWLISPELNGCSQVIELYSIGYFTFRAPWEIHYSTTGRDTTDMKLLKADSYNLNNWKKFSYTLPEGTKYFALRAVHVGPGSQPPICCFDDFKYIPAGKGEGSLIGYNIYCNGKLLNQSPITATSFKAQKSPDGGTIYKVTAVYDRGESRPVAIDINNGVSSISNTAINVASGHGSILITTPDSMPCTVYSIQGMKVAEIRLSAGQNEIPVSEGIYIVTLNGKAYKLSVR